MKHDVVDLNIFHTYPYIRTFIDEAQTVLFKDPVRTAL